MEGWKLSEGEYLKKPLSENDLSKIFVNGRK